MFMFISDECRMQNKWYKIKYKNDFREYIWWGGERRTKLLGRTIPWRHRGFDQLGAHQKTNLSIGNATDQTSTPISTPWKIYC